MSDAIYLQPGVCRYCGCTDDEACEGGCAWIDMTATVCSNPVCLARHQEEKKERAR